VVPALERPRERGELGPRAIPERAATSIGVLLRDEMLLSRNAVGPDTIAEITDTVYLPLVAALSRQPAKAPSPARRRRTSSPAPHA
jgi:hypothetical protein